jgi:lysophospholipase
VRDLRDRGFAVAMIDWRGQGHSSRRLRDPRKGYVRDFSDFEVDVETFVQQVVLPDCPPPYFALAHSMGGAVMLRLAHAGKRWFDRMVLSTCRGAPPRSPRVPCCGSCGLRGRAAVTCPAAATR